MAMNATLHLIAQEMRASKFEDTEITELCEAGCGEPQAIRRKLCPECLKVWIKAPYHVGENGKSAYIRWIKQQRIKHTINVWKT